MYLLFFTPFLEGTSFKLSAIIANLDTRGAKMREEIFPHEFHHLFSCDDD